MLRQESKKSKSLLILLDKAKKKKIQLNGRIILLYSKPLESPRAKLGARFSDVARNPTVGCERSVACH